MSFPSATSSSTASRTLACETRFPLSRTNRAEGTQ